MSNRLKWLCARGGGMDDPDVPIDAVKRSHQVIDALRERGTAGVTELADALGLPKSTAHNHLRTLERLGYVVEADGEYRLSAKFLVLGRESRNARDVYAHGRRKVRSLEEESGRYVQLVVEEHGLGTILLATRWRDEELPPSARHVYPTHLHLHANAPGKAILARIPDDRVDEIVDRHGLPARTDRTVTDADALRAELTEVRERGYAVDRGELIEGIVGVGAPIATDETVYGALGAYGPAPEMREELSDGDLPTRLRRTAEDIRADIAFDALE